ncbi:MAG: PAS domain S-box protein [Cyanosarcina radialis HA8281-LM2]|jgi:PAS domain S-box-containing protein|nr:PAS domain S-box protein [Cyanosarcina radialis HA8281-LM2]
MSQLAIVGVGDRPEVLQTLAEQLTRSFGRDYAIELAASSEEALERLARLELQGIDVPLVICDYSLSGMRADELLREINARYPQTLKVMLTETTSTEVVGKIVNTANLYRYLVKPWDEIDLILTVKEALRSFDRERVLSQINATGEQKIAERTAELIAANKQLQTEIEMRQQAEEELQLFFSQSLDGFFFMMLDEPVQWDNTIDKEKALDYIFTRQRITKVNDAMLRQYGVSREQFLGLTPNDFFAHNLAYGRELWRRFFDAGRLHVETDERRFDGTPIWVEGDYICLYDDRGRIVGHFGVQRDVSARRQAEADLCRSQERYTIATTQSLVGVWDWNLATNEIYLSPNLKAMLGYEENEIPDRIEPWADLVHPDDKAAVMAAAQAHLDGLTPVYEMPHRMLHKDGSVRWFLVRGVVFRDENGKPFRMAGTDTDITQLKQAELAMRQRVELERLVSSISTQLIDLNADRIDSGIQQALQQIGEFTEVDRTYMFQMSEDGRLMTNTHEWCAAGIESQIHGLQSIQVEVCPWLMAKLQTLEILYIPQVAELPPEASREKAFWQSKSVQSILCFPLVARDRLIGCVGFQSIRTAKIWTEARVNLLKLVGEILASALARKQVEEALRLTQFAIDRAADAVFWVDSEARFLYFNEAACRLSGYSREELLNMRVYDLDPNFPPEVWAKSWEELKVKGHLTIEGYIRTASDRILAVEITANYLQFQGQEAQCTFVRDISERQAALRDRQRAAEEIERTQMFLDSIVENIPNMIFVKDAKDLRFVRFNKAGEELLGYDRSELLGKNDYDFFLSEQADFFTAKDREVLESGSLLDIPSEPIQTKNQGLRLLHTKKLPILDRDGKPLYLLGISEDITEWQIAQRDRLQAEAALRESEERFRQLTENINAVFWMTNLERNQIIYLSPACEQICGYTLADLYTSTTRWLDFIHPEDRDRVRKAFFNQLPGHYDEEYRIIRPDGEIRWIRDRAFPVYNKAGEIYRIAGLAEDITEQQAALRERQQAENALRQSEGQNRAILEAMPDLMLRVKKDGTCLDMRFPKSSGGGDFVAIDRHLSEVLSPELLQRQLRYIELALTTGELQVYEHQLVKRGQNTYEELRISASGPDEVLIVVRDITDRKLADAQIQASLQEKEVLLKEIHHRVKNNLYIISSLLDWQADTTEDRGMLDVFTEIQNRIQTMVLIHEQLYQSKDLGQVDFGEYIGRLVENLCFSYSQLDSYIQPHLEVASVLLNLETAIPCGLLINELVTNSLKHAFPKGRSGEIYIQFHQDKDELLHLRVQDNGIGIPDRINWQNSPSLGLKLVRILAQQLRAKIECDRTNGTSFSLTFQELNYRPRF